MTADSRIRTVILHIGRHKTGTSSIQATLAVHRTQLSEQGVLYPESLPPNHSGVFVDAVVSCQRPLLGTSFLEQLQRVFMTLSEPVRREMYSFLETRISAGSVAELCGKAGCDGNASGQPDGV